MQEITLEPRRCAKGRSLRIEFIEVEWDRERVAFVAMVMFERARDRPDNRPLGAALYANNAETLAKMLQEDRKSTFHGSGAPDWRNAGPVPVGCPRRQFGRPVLPADGWFPRFFPR